MKKDSRYKKLGFKQALQRDWLDCAILLLLQNEPEIRNKLSQFIKAQDTITGERADGSVKYTMSILGAWISPELELLQFRNQLLKQAQKMDKNGWSILHWAILCASYPFLLNVSTVIGRLFSLQEFITKGQILARLSEIYGEREVVERNMRYAIQTMINLNFLRKVSTQKGIYVEADRISIDSDFLALLLWKAILLATEGNRISLTSLRNSLALYPFLISQPSLDRTILMEANIEIVCFGGETDFLSIAQYGVETCRKNNPSCKRQCHKRSLSED